MQNRQLVTAPWRQALRQSLTLLALALILSFVVNSFRSNSLPWFETSGPPLKETGLEISLEEAQIFYLTGQAVFLDARSPEDYRAGHIEKALSLPWMHFAERASEALSGLGKETLIITYCDAGCGLSQELAMALIAQGFNQVRVLANGWSAWMHYGLPVATGP